MGEIREVKRFEVISVAKVSLATGLIIGVLYAVYVFVLSFFWGTPPEGRVELTYNGIFGKLEAPRVIFLFLFPVIACVCTMIYGVILALIYNIVSKKIGGIRYHSDT